MAYLPIEEREVFRRYRALANWAWRLATGWPEFARDTIGKQLVRAADSICANMVEGDGRGTDADALRSFLFARASGREARYWISCASDRALVNSDVAAAQLADLLGATQLLNNLIRYRRQAVQTGRAEKVREQVSGYSVLDPDPFACDLDEDYSIALILADWEKTNRDVVSSGPLNA